MKTGSLAGSQHLFAKGRDFWPSSEVSTCAATRGGLEVPSFRGAASLSAGLKRGRQRVQADEILSRSNMCVGDINWRTRSCEDRVQQLPDLYF